MMITNPEKLKDLVEWKVMRDQRNLNNNQWSNNDWADQVHDKANIFQLVETK